MIREKEFRTYRNPYAVDLSTLKAEQHTWKGGTGLTGTVDAVWVRSKGREGTFASIGKLSLYSTYDYTACDPDDPVSVLSSRLEGRYGGTCEGRWDGENYCGSSMIDTIAAHMAVLAPLHQACMEAFSNGTELAVPDGYDGWWTFWPPRVRRAR